MIVHVVLLKPKPELTDEERRAIVAETSPCGVDDSKCRRLRVGKRVRHGRPGYEQPMGQDFEYAVLIEFDDVAGTSRLPRASAARGDRRCTSCSRPRQRSRTTTR